MPDSAASLYLMSAARFVEHTDAGLVEIWGAAGHAETGDITPFSTEVAAAQETARRVAFRGAPVQEERAVVPVVVGLDLVRGRCVSIDGQTVFVLGGSCDHGRGVTTLDILRRVA